MHFRGCWVCFNGFEGFFFRISRCILNILEFWTIFWRWLNNCEIHQQFATSFDHISNSFHSVMLNDSRFIPVDYLQINAQLALSLRKRNLRNSSFTSGLISQIVSPYLKKHKNIIQMQHSSNQRTKPVQSTSNSHLFSFFTYHFDSNQIIWCEQVNVKVPSNKNTLWILLNGISSSFFVCVMYFLDGSFFFVSLHNTDPHLFSLKMRIIFA